MRLLKSKNRFIRVSYDIIYTIIDELTKYIKFISCKTTMNIEQLSTLLLKKVFMNYNIFE